MTNLSWGTYAGSDLTNGTAGRDYHWFSTEFSQPKILSIKRILFLAWLVLIAVIFDAHFNYAWRRKNTSDFTTSYLMT